MVLITPNLAPPLRSAKDVLRRLYGHARKVQMRFGSPLRFAKPVFDTRTVSANNFAHLLLDIIPLCLYARQCVGLDVSFAFDNLDLRARELLSAFAIYPTITRKRIVGPIVHMRGIRGLAVFNLRDTFGCPALTFFPDTYGQYDFKATVQYDKVFFARRGDASSQESPGCRGATFCARLHNGVHGGFLHPRPDQHCDACSTCGCDRWGGHGFPCA